LKTALNVSLRQSPFLNVLSEIEVSKTLHMMTRLADTKLNHRRGPRVLSADGQQDIVGSIANPGTEYVQELRAVNCQNGADPA